MTGGLSLLLVEDNPGDVVLVHEALRECGTPTQVDHAATLAAALARTEASRPDAVLLDLNLPDSRGVETVISLRRHAPRIPIVVFTGTADEAVGLEAVRSGAQDYLVKGRQNGAAILRAVWYAIERKHIEDRLLSVTEALEASNRALDEFASVASHDLREPLAKMVTLSRLSLESRTDVADEERVLLEEILSSGRRMQRLVDALLAYAHAVGAPPALEPVDLGAVIEAVRADLGVRIADSGARITVTTLPRVRGDRVQLYQVFQNLLSNALKFSKPGVPPEIAITCVEDETDRFATVCVRDNGAGFANTEADRIFKPFARLSRGADGVGLGLAIVRRIVEGHGGQVSAVGDPQRGAAFSVRLPLAEGPELPSPS